MTDSKSSPPIYLDHNATSPFDLEHFDRVREMLFEKPYGNASSPHAAGRRASHLVSLARKSLAEALGVNPAEIVFLASASEANNTVLKGIDWASNARGHCVSTAFEHPSISAVLKNKPQVTSVGAQAHHKGQSNEVEWTRSVVAQITSSTQLITVMAANNETGHKFPVKLLGDFLHKLRFPESSYWENAGTQTSAPSATEKHCFHALFEALDKGVTPEILKKVHFHVDATQAFGKLPAKDWVSPGVDSFSVSGHKARALPGGAALVVRRGRALHPLIEGGGQERFRRAGTENLPAIVSLGLRSAEMLHDAYWAKMAKVRQLALQLEVELSRFSHLQVLSDALYGLPNTVHAVSLDRNLKAEDTLIELDLRGIQASSGSACSSGTNRPSQVVLGLGFTEEVAQNALRFSLGLNTTQTEIAAVVKALAEIFAAQKI